MSEFEERLKKAVARGASKAESLLSEDQRKPQADPLVSMDADDDAEADADDDDGCES